MHRYLPSIIDGTRTHTYTLGEHQVKEALTAGTLNANAIDPKGDTLLHLAARNGHKAIVKEALHTHKHTHAHTHTNTH